MTMTDKEIDRVLELANICKDEEIFSFENLLIKGNKVNIIKRYVKRNPSSKFYVWLIDNCEIIKTEV